MIGRAKMYPAARGLSVVQLVISDAHEGLKAAISSVLSGASWQRCRVHFLRNILALVPKRAFPYVLSPVKSIFAQSDRPSAQRQLGQVAAEFEGKYHRVAKLPLDAEDEVLTYMDFPADKP